MSSESKNRYNSIKAIPFNRKRNQGFSCKEKYLARAKHQGIKN
jgi:hypothetical protein